MKYLEYSNSQKVEQQLPGAGGRGNRELFKGYRVSIFQDEKILKICCTKMCIQLMYTLKWLKILKIKTILFKGLGALRKGWELQEKGKYSVYHCQEKACFFQLQHPAQCFLLTDDSFPLITTTIHPLSLVLLCTMYCQEGLKKGLKATNDDRSLQFYGKGRTFIKR